MRAVVQRVSSASVVAENWNQRIDRGLVVLLGVERGDGAADAAYMARKIREVRAFENDSGKDFDRSVQEIGGQVLIISQFTLGADCRKGRRPSFDEAAAPALAEPLYESVVLELRRAGLVVATGRFRARMQVSLVNEGPVTLLLDSRNRF